jgi:hypothetical protein
MNLEEDVFKKLISLVIKINPNIFSVSSDSSNVSPTVFVFKKTVPVKNNYVVEGICVIDQLFFLLYYFLSFQ